MTQATHDPSPLQVQTCINRDETLIFSERRLIGSTIGLGHKANAERFARAWNCHDELLEALKAIVPIVADLDSMREAGEPEAPELVAARAAIAKAEAK